MLSDMLCFLVFWMAEIDNTKGTIINDPPSSGRKPNISMWHLIEALPYYSRIPTQMPNVFHPWDDLKINEIHSNTHLSSFWELSKLGGAKVAWQTFVGNVCNMICILVYSLVLSNAGADDGSGNLQTFPAIVAWILRTKEPLYRSILLRTMVLAQGAMSTTKPRTHTQSPSSC